MANIQPGASAEADARYRNQAQAYLSFDQAGSSVGANTPLPNSYPTGYIGPTHVGSMPTPPAAQGSAPTQSTAPTAGPSRGLFASQPVLPTIEEQRTPLPFSNSQGHTPSHQSLGFSTPAGPSGNNNLTPAPAYGGWDNRAATEATHISETQQRGSTIIPETPLGRQPNAQSSQFVPSSISSVSLGSSAIGNLNSPRPVDPAMGNGPQLMHYPPNDQDQGDYELPPPGGQRPRDSSEVSQIPASQHNPQQTSSIRNDGSLSSLPIEVPLHFPSSPPRLSGPMGPSSSPPYDGGFPSSSQHTNRAATPTPNPSSSQASGAGPRNSSLAPPRPQSSGLFVPEPSPFNPSQFPAPLSSSQSQPQYNPNLEIHSPAPNAPLPALNNILIPPALRDLQARLNHDRRSFQPALQSRNLRVDERGYWFILTSNWTPQQWLATWAYLTEFVGSGNAGWGVSVRREGDGSQLRVYCFGTMVEHVWWLLFQASEGSTVATGGEVAGCWGEVVLEVPPRPY
ncbi:hypothetical protein PG984_004927 [Apiospora sp. TS-2023a]